MTAKEIRIPKNGEYAKNSNYLDSFFIFKKCKTANKKSTSQSRTVSLSLAPQLASEHLREVSFNPIVSTSKSLKYLKNILESDNQRIRG